ncbi:hypothetical protein ACFYMO_11540 [Streptomyces sp. NPDC007025]|uniref:hypothetical protein n=1 Tax=Streptomyces sp. NPDC007025 TaxID=3364771 RepID=UPI00369FAEDF
MSAESAPSAVHAPDSSMASTAADTVVLLLIGPPFDAGGAMSVHGGRRPVVDLFSAGGSAADAA